MKRLATTLCLLAGLLATLPAAEKPAAPKNSPPKTDTVVWAGVDYSMVRMIGPGEFTQPESIFPGMLEAWNNLFLQERLKFAEKETRKHVVVDISGVTAANKAATSKQIINAPGSDDTVDKSHISSQDLARAVRSYKLENKSGLGVVFVVDRLVKLDKKGRGGGLCGLLQHRNPGSALHAAQSQQCRRFRLSQLLVPGGQRRRAGSEQVSVTGSCAGAAFVDRNEAGMLASPRCER